MLTPRDAPPLALSLPVRRDVHFTPSCRPPPGRLPQRSTAAPRVTGGRVGVRIVSHH